MKSYRSYVVFLQVATVMCLIMVESLQTSSHKASTPNYIPCMVAMDTM